MFLLIRCSLFLRSALFICAPEIIRASARRAIWRFWIRFVPAQAFFLIGTLVYLFHFQWFWHQRLLSSFISIAILMIFDWLWYLAIAKSLKPFQRVRSELSEISPTDVLFIGLEELSSCATKILVEYATGILRIIENTSADEDSSWFSIDDLEESLEEQHAFFASMNLLPADHDLKMIYKLARAALAEQTLIANFEL